ncbi:MAG: chemotaxis protein CheX [Planctomycetaceae bacterium]|nr:chemotaxis protein CheX [Planctomycetaceae bacterium]
MAVDNPTMCQIISNVFDDMLAMPTQVVDRPVSEFNTDRIVAAIRISGSVEEVVVVEAPTASASLIGETMFAADPGTLASEEICDAVGEVVNMIGGNVKGLYDGDSKLSLPCVSQESGVVDSGFGNGDTVCVNVSGHPVLVRWHDVTPAAV